MAPLPKRRHSSARQAKRTRALKSAGVTLTKCENCGLARLPHVVCSHCGFYDGKLIVAPKNKNTKK